MTQHEMSELRGQTREGQRKVAGGLRGAASWLESRDLGDLMNELRGFARRHSGMFLTGATFTGVLVGRLSRNMVAKAKNDDAGAAPARS